MKNCVESDIEFDFSLARRVCEHDTTTPKCDTGSTPDGNTYWPGVDFRIEDDDGWIWLEVKDWRGRMAGSFGHKMRSKDFAEQMRGKFLGTTAFLAWNQIFQSNPVRYVLLFEPPSTFDTGLLAPFQDLVRKEMNTARRLNIETYVMPLDGWNAVFDYFPAQKRR